MYLSICLMYIGIISLADRIAHNIKSDDIKQEILNEFHSLYGIKIIQKHDHKLDERNAEYIKTHPHLISLRSNGNRYILYFTKYNDIEIIYLIDLKIHSNYTLPRIILLRGLFHKDLYKNTVIYCEMVKSETGWICLLNDIVVYKGQKLSKESLPERLEILYKMLDKEYTEDEVIDICKFKVKTYLYASAEGLTALMEMSEKLNYTSRGIYFWPYDNKYKPKLYNFNENKIITVVRNNKSDNIFKEATGVTNVTNVLDGKTKTKESSPINAVVPSGVTGVTGVTGERRTLYLSKSNDPDIYNIYETENILISKKIGIALIPNLATSKMIRQAFANSNITATIKVSCAYNEKFNKWYPVEIIV